ncbi:MAG: hypothetical protein LQ339_007958 [Xanthoria mediterranea]|nr:MAG: hypothetical protein LQ339_007958 [Xanthoria mediterranea]
MSDAGYSDPDGMLGVFPLPVTPSDVSPGETTPLRADVSATHDQQHNKKASIVDYNDENEQLNSDFQLIFDQNAQIGRQSSWRYDKVAVLLISWDGSCDDLNTKGEVDNLARMFHEIYKYKIQNVRLKSNSSRHPQVEVNKIMAEFVWEEDGPSTLLLVYYAGHGAPGQRPGNLELKGESSPTIDNAATVVWNYAEAALQQTKADILEIFDCCYAGDLARGSCGRGFGTRCFEFLGATSSGATTRAPGPSSFSSGLIWALGALAKESDRFTTNKLVNKIREAPNFPKKQVPVLTERNDLSSLNRIVIAPLLNADEASTAVPAEETDTTRRQPWGFLNLRLSLESCPEKAEIAKFGEDVRCILQSTELKVQGVKWAGLYRSLPNVGIYPPMLDNRFEVDEKVWMRNPANGVFEWLMWVVEKRYDANKPGWEYTLKDKDHELYRQGAWLGVTMLSKMELTVSGPSTVCSKASSAEKGEKKNSLRRWRKPLARDKFRRCVDWTFTKSIRRVKLWRFPTSKSMETLSKCIVRKIEECPNGYPKVAGFMDSEDTFGIYRRFGFLYSRVLLSKQDELRRLEDDLDAMDHRDAHDSDKTRKCLKSRAKDFARESSDGSPTRKALLQNVESKLYDYGQILLQAQQMVSLNKPAHRDHLSVQRFLESGYEDNGQKLRPLMEGDNEFIYRKEDLVTLRPGRESAWLDAFVERLLKMIHCKPVQYIFCSKETRLKSNSPYIHYYTKQRVDRLVTLIISGIMLFLLVVPTYALYRVTEIKASTMNATCIGILLVATLVFSAVLSLFTKAKRHEILGASAAYCAVLVVFIGNVNGGKGGLAAL